MIEAYTATSASENARPLSRPRDDDDKKVYTHAGDVSLVIELHSLRVPFGAVSV